MAKDEKPIPAIDLRDPSVLADIVAKACYEMGKEGHPVVRQAWSNLANGANQVKTGLAKIARDRIRFDALQQARIAEREATREAAREAAAEPAKRKRRGRRDDTGISAVSDDPPTELTDDAGDESSS